MAVQDLDRPVCSPLRIYVLRQVRSPSREQASVLKQFELAVGGAALGVDRPDDPHRVVGAVGDVRELLDERLQVHECRLDDLGGVYRHRARHARGADVPHDPPGLRNLKVKFVGHVGEVAAQTVGGRGNLVGVDMITVHRMLKNAVPAPEYVLMTESLLEQCGANMRRGAREIEQDLEGLGPARLHFLDLEKIALERPPPPKPHLIPICTLIGAPPAPLRCASASDSEKSPSYFVPLN